MDLNNSSCITYNSAANNITLPSTGVYLVEYGVAQDNSTSNGYGVGLALNQILIPGTDIGLVTPLQLTTATSLVSITDVSQLLSLYNSHSSFTPQSQSGQATLDSRITAFITIVQLTTTAS